MRQTLILLDHEGRYMAPEIDATRRFSWAVKSPIYGGIVNLLKFIREVGVEIQHDVRSHRYEEEVWYETIL